MADTLTNTPIPAEEYQDVYTFTSITPGSPITIQNVGVTDLFFTIASTQPAKNNTAFRIFKRGEVIEATDGDLSVWVFSPQAKGAINVEEMKISIPSDFLFEVAKENIPRHNSLGFLTRKTAVGTSFEDLWGESGSMVYPTEAETWEIVSDNANDNSTGTGGRTAVIISLDENFLLRTDVVSLNGLTPVTIPGLHIRPQQVIITQSGSSRWNEGTIRVRDQTTPANIRNHVRPEEATSIDGHITVPGDKNGFIAQTFTIFPKNVDGFSLIQIRDASDPDASWITATSIPIYQNQVPFEVKAFFPLAPKTDLNSRAIVTSGTGDITIIFEFIFVDI